MNDIRLSYSLWVEKYRPITIKELILPKSIKTTFTKLVSDGELPNLLFHSSTPGTGKTSTAQCLINDIGMDSIYINGSLEGIDSVRDKIIGFASSMSFSNKPKAIIIDEADGFSVQGQKSLRGVIEQFQSTCRFIFTCNAVSTIHEAIQSRCQSFSFNYTDAKTKEEMIPKIIKRIELILKLEKVEFDSEVVIKLVSKYFPDIRKVINIIQQYSKEKNVIDSGVLTFETISDELINYVIQKKFTKARENHKKE